MKNRAILQTALIALVAAIFVAGSHQTYQNIVEATNKSQLKDLAARSIHRLELATDLAVTTIAKIQRRGLTTCTPEAIAAFKQYVMTVGSIKDIRLHSAGKACAVFSANSLKSDLRNAKMWEQGRNSTIQLSVRTKDENHSLLVLWKSQEYDLIAAVSTGGLLYDMVPSFLRPHLNMRIALMSGRQIATYQPEATDYKEAASQPEQIHFTALSKRYPIKAQLTINRCELMAWNNSNATLIDLLGAFIGLFVGFLAARALFPPLGPIDELDKAIANGEFVPHFQPIINLRSSEIAGFEMLARWQKPDGSMVSPGSFIPLAENFGRIDAILFALLRSTGLSIGKELRANPYLKLTFNVTPDQFLDPEFLPHLLGVIKLVDLPSHCLIAEITERQPINDLDLACEMIAQYKTHGIRIAIDDAGTGHNGLSSIQKLDVSTIKLDKIFIDGIVNNERARQMIQLLVNLARQYQMNVVAEGIETPDQALAALAMGIQEGQGFYFARPLPAHDLRTLLDEQKKPLAQNNTPKINPQSSAKKQPGNIRIAS